MNGGHVGLGWFDAKIPPWSLAPPRCPLPSSSSQQYSPVQKAFTFTISTFSALWLFDCESVIWSPVNLIVDIFNQQIGRNYFGDIEKTKCVKILRSSGNVCCLINRGSKFQKKAKNVKNLLTPELAALPRAAKGLQVIDSFLLVMVAVLQYWVIKMVAEDLMGSFGATAGFSASLLGEPSPPSWLPCVLPLHFMYIPCIIAFIFLLYSLYNCLYISLYSLYNWHLSISCSHWWKCKGRHH